MARTIRLVGAVTHPPELKHVEAALDKWEEQGKVLKKDFGEVFSYTVWVGIVKAMIPKSIQEPVCSRLGVAVEDDAIRAKIFGLVSNKVAMADEPTLMDVDRVAVDYTNVPTEYSDDDHEIDVINMSIHFHGCGGWGAPSQSARPRWLWWRSNIRQGARVLEKETRVRAKESAGSATGGKGKRGFLGMCFKCGEAGHRKQDCTKVGAIDDVVPISDTPTNIVESVWDFGNVDVDGGWQTQNCPKKVFPAWFRLACQGQRSRVARAQRTELPSHAHPPGERSQV